MRSTLKISNINFWPKILGLLPIPLFHKSKKQNQYVLLNGPKGNFCVDFDDEIEVKTARYRAWSSNVNHYVQINKNKVCVSRWDRMQKEEYSIASVVDKVDKFYEYLLKDQSPTESSIIAFSIQIFRKLRAILQDQKGYNTLNSFLILLACHAKQVDRKKIDITKWSLSEETMSSALTISEGDWQALNEELRRGIPALDLIPDLSLLLRHTSGTLFQEAHFETLFTEQYQLRLDGFLPAPSTLINKTNYSGVHYTPTSLVRVIVEEAILGLGDLSKLSNVRVLDPACGSGEFLKEFLRQLKETNFAGNVELFGYDISQTAVNITNFILAFEKQLWMSNLSYTIETKNALLEASLWPDSVDIILMNPPFISWESMNKDNRDIVNQVLGSIFDKKPNSASAFLWKAVSRLKAGGIIGTVLPTSIFDADSYNKIRKYLNDILSVLLIGKLGSHHIFSNALVDASIFIAKKTKSTKNEIVTLWCDYKLESSSAAFRSLRKFRKTRSTIFPINENNFSLYLNSSLSVNNNWTPISYSSWQLLSKLNHLKKAKDLFEIKQGVRTGLNSVFLVEKKYFRSLSKKEKIYFRPAVTNDSIQDSHLSDIIYIFYPAGDNLKRMKNTADLKKYVPTYYSDYLKPNYDKLLNRARKNKDNWWQLSEHRAWQIKSQPKLISTEFGTSGSFVYDKNGDYVVERGHAWFPKYRGKLHNDIEEISYAYVAIFAMDIIDKLLNAISKQIGGGQWYLSSKYIYNLPMPDLFSGTIDQKLFEDLKNIGICLSTGKNIDRPYLNSLDKYLF